jgi:hypothetical protein
MSLNIGQPLITIDGPGILEAIEHYNRIDGGTDRFGVRLETQKYAYPVSYYWPHEIVRLQPGLR